VLKLSDLFSDCFFIHEVGEYNDTIDTAVIEGKEDDADFYNFPGIYISAIFFTVIGFLFYLFKALVYLKERRERGCLDTQPDADSTEEEPEKKKQWWEYLKFWKQDEEAKDEWVWWKHSNFVFEEVPQLILAIMFLTEVGLTNYFAENLTALEIEEREKSEWSATIGALVSGLFSLFGMIMTVFRFGRVRGWWCPIGGEGGNTEDGEPGDYNQTTPATELSPLPTEGGESMSDPYKEWYSTKPGTLPTQESMSDPYGGNETSY
jgi:hypothetical protein